MTARRWLFWGGVAGIALLAPFGVALVAHRTNWAGLQRFRSFTYGNGAS